MTLIQAIIFLAGFAIVAYLLYWVITKFFPAPSPAQMPLLALAGVLLLVILLTQIFPGTANFRLWN